MPSLMTTLCRAASSSQARATSRWRVQREQRHCVVCTSCSRSQPRRPDCSSSVRCRMGALRCVPASLRHSRMRRCTALEQWPRIPVGSASSTHRCALFHAQQTWQRYTTASTRSACSTVPGIAPWSTRGVARAMRWLACVHARRTRVRRCTRPTSMTHCARAPPWPRAVAARRACPLRWTMLCSMALRASCGRCVRAIIKLSRTRNA